MQRGVAYRGATDEDRLQLGDGREFAGPADLHANAFDLGYASPCGIFVGNRPARCLAGEAKLVLQACAIDFHDDAIDFIGQRLTLGFPLLDEGPDFFHVASEFAALIDFETGSVERFERFPMAVKVVAAVSEQHVREVVEAALGGDAGIELADGACGCVAGICEERQALGFAFFVHFLESGQRHKQLTAHFEVAG